MLMQKRVSVKLTVKSIEVSDVTCICRSHADRFNTVTPQHRCVRLCLTKKCPDARARRKSHLSDRSEPHLAFDDHKMLFWPRSSFFSSNRLPFPTSVSLLSPSTPPSRPPRSLYNFLILLLYFFPSHISTIFSVRADDSSVMSCCIYHRISVCYYSCALPLCTTHNLKQAGFLSQ